MRQLALGVSHAGANLACDVAGWMLFLGTAGQAALTAVGLQFGRGFVQPNAHGLHMNAVHSAACM
jgi:hypothetical protein